MPFLARLLLSHSNFFGERAYVFAFVRSFFCSFRSTRCSAHSVFNSCLTDSGSSFFLPNIIVGIVFRGCKLHTTKAVTSICTAPPPPPLPPKSEDEAAKKKYIKRCRHFSVANRGKGKGKWTRENSTQARIYHSQMQTKSLISHTSLPKQHPSPENKYGRH